MKTPYSEQSPRRVPRVDWGDALAVPNFYGRTQEQALLTQWLLNADSRIVCILGMGGIGKSSLAVNIMHQLTQMGSGQIGLAPVRSWPAHPRPFDIIIFRSLRDAPSCEALLDDCLQALSPQPLSVLPTTLDQRLTLLLEYLHKTRTLLVLDNLECLLQEGDVRGHFRPGFKEYELLLHRVVETVHQSCLLLTSREKPAELQLLEGRYPSVHTLRLTGLEVAACQQFFLEKGTEPSAKIITASLGSN